MTDHTCEMTGCTDPADRHGVAYESLVTVVSTSLCQDCYSTAKADGKILED